MVAKVLLRTKQAEIDKAFDYLVPKSLEDAVCPGMRVLVPFGVRNTKTEGYILSLSDTTAVPAHRLKPVLSLPEAYPLFSGELISLAMWMQETYYCTLSQCLQTMMPAGIAAKTNWLVYLTGRMEELTIAEQQLVSVIQEAGGTCKQVEIVDKFSNQLKSLKEKGVIGFRQETKTAAYERRVRFLSLAVLAEDALKALGSNKRVEAQRQVILALAEQDHVPLQEFLQQTGTSASTVNTLRHKGFVTLTEEEMLKGIEENTYPLPKDDVVPTAAQEKVLQEIDTIRKKQVPKPVLLHGITGSGKTEVYLQTIARVLQEGKQAIVLVPEISLTPQTVARFVSRFGDQVAVTHSRLSLTERHDAWKRARTGAAKVMIGPRSAIFAPFSNLGLIIVDEAHEASYVSELTPKYHAVAVAKKRCEQNNGLLLLGSATPSIEQYREAEIGNFHLLRLSERVGAALLPEVSVVDMRQELANGNRTMFSLPLVQEIEATLNRGKQTILFLNRRGYATFVSCRSCGYVVTCDHCAVSMTYHAGAKKLRCHYCGQEKEIPKVCPACGSPHIRYFGTGTQKVEEAVQKRFPSARVLRMDADTTKKKHGYRDILTVFGRGEADILIGTQMIAKGHDFAGVTLVGVLAADLSLHMGDFRGAETTFQLLTQVAGRAGRGKDPGKVIIQTYDPNHYSIQCAAAQDYTAFYQAETALRQQMGYPPFGHIASLLITGEQEKEVIDGARTLSDLLVQETELQILGPSPATISKLKSRYRWRILIKAEDEALLRKEVVPLIGKWKKICQSGLLVDLTIDPLMIV